MKRYKHALYAIQDFYTKSFDKHKKKCNEVFDKKEKHVPITVAIEIAFLFSVGPENYNLSTGDTPYHALRYSVGIKSYGEQKETRLRPRWNQALQAQFPYSGKLYTLLFDLNSYLALNPRHLVSLNGAKEVSIGVKIIPERETTFNVMIPGQHVMDVLVTKYPDFNAPYTPYYLYKYGMSESMYNQFKEKLKGSKPHSPQNKTTKLLLGEHLCAYHEAWAIETARLEAQAQKGWLVYRDFAGGFSLVPPPLNPETQGTRKESGDVKRKQQTNLLDARKNLPAEGALEILVQHYSVIAASNFRALVYHQFPKIKWGSLSKIRAPITIDDEWIKTHFIEDVQNTMSDEVLITFKMIFNYLYNLAILTKSVVALKSFLFSSSKVGHISASSENNALETPQHAFLYLGGNGVYFLEPKLSPSLLEKRPERTEAMLTQEKLGFILFAPPKSRPQRQESLQLPAKRVKI